MFWDFFDICVFQVAENMWDFQIIVPFSPWSLEAYKMITNEEIDIQLRILAIWVGKDRVTVELFWILMFESYSKRAQNWQADTHTHTHTHTRTRTRTHTHTRAMHRTPSVRRKDLPVLSICFTFWNKYILPINIS